jgi:hypothetical protein
MPASRCPLCGYQGDDFARRRDGRLVCLRCGEAAGDAGAEPVDVEGRTLVAGTSLAAVGGMTLLASLAWLVISAFFAPPPVAPPPDAPDAARRAFAVGYYFGAYGPGTVGTALGIIVLAGGVQLARRRTYPLAVLGAVAAMLPCSCGFVLGLPIGIWALVVLWNPQVRAAFE